MIRTRSRSSIRPRPQCGRRAGSPFTAGGSSAVHAVVMSDSLLAGPDTATVMGRDRTHDDVWLVEGLHGRYAGSGAAYSEAGRIPLTSGGGALVHLEGDDLLGADNEATSGGSHPGDLGVVRHPGAYTRMPRGVLRSPAHVSQASRRCR